MKYFNLSILTLLMLTLAACSGDEGPVPASPADDVVALSFSVPTSGIPSRSRADQMGHVEVTGEYRLFEEGIDLNDLGVFIFAKLTSSTEAEKLVFKVTDFTNRDEERVVITGSPGDYIVNVFIRRELLRTVLGLTEETDISPNGTRSISFRILIMANSISGGTAVNNPQSAWNRITGQDYPAVLNQFASWHYVMSNIYNPDGDSTAESLYSHIKKYCPMFGTALFTAREYDLYYSRPENRVYLGDIDMLRSLAKVRVIDNIETRSAQGYPYISAVDIVSSKKELLPVPYDVASYENGQQVHTPNIYKPDEHTEDIFRLGTIPESWSMSAWTTNTRNVFIGYVPEQSIAIANGNVDQGMPMFRITVATSATESTVYEVPMTRYQDIAFGFGSSILRNHIYTLNVTDVGINLKAVVDLVPYRACSLDPWFGIDREEEEEEELPGIV